MKHKDRPTDKRWTCPECDKNMQARGIGGHLYKAHGIRGGVRALLNKSGVKQSVKQSVKQNGVDVKQVVKRGDKQYAKRCGVSIERLRCLRYLESIGACFMCERQKLELECGVCDECRHRKRW